MNKKIQQFLDSGLLDKYLIGATTEKENKTVEQYLSSFPELKNEFEIREEQLEFAARNNAIKPKVSVLKNVLNAIDETPVYKLNKTYKLWSRYTIAACAALLLFATTSIIFYMQSRTLIEENDTIAEEIFDLRKDIKDNNEKLDEVMNQFMKLNNPETQKYVLRGNERAKELKTVAYINPIEKSSLIDVVSLPVLSDEECFQMWANVNNKMINLGILNDTNSLLKSIPYIEDALSLSITIEPKGGNTVASLENEVAEIPINRAN